MTDTIIVPPGTSTPQTTTQPGETFVVRFATRIETNGASAITLANDDTRLANSGEVRSFGAPAVVVAGDFAVVENDRDVAESLVGPPPPPAAGVILVTPGASDGSLRLLPDGTFENGTFPAGPLIRSDTTAIEVQGQNALIVNTGVIRGDVNGVDFVNGGMSSGVLENFGLIESESRGVNIGGTGVTVVNEGVIVTTQNARNGVIYTDVTSDDFFIINGASGVIEGAEGTTAHAVSIELGEVVVGVLLNDGDIVSRGEASGVWIYSPVGGPSRFEAFIDNAGSITSEATTGLNAGIRVDDGVDIVGELRNAGVISGTWNGIYLGDGNHGALDIVNEDGGLITSQSRAVNIGGSGLTLINDGDITVTGNARNGVVYADGDATGYTIINGETGRIGGAPGVRADAISLQVDDEANGAILNEGLISGAGGASGGVASGLRVFSDDPERGSIFDGFIVNEETGRIETDAVQGVSAAILVQDGVSFIGTIDNAGVIDGARNGIYIGEGEHELRIVNEAGGVIASASRAVNIDGSGVELVNRGLITSDSAFDAGPIRNGVIYSDDTANQFSIFNSGVIEVAQGDSGDAISLQLGANVEASLVNDGMIVGRGAPEGAGFGSGLRLFSGVDGVATFRGEITNTGTINSDSEAAILIQEGVRVLAQITNTGDLNGAAALDARASDFGVTFLQTAGNSNGDLLFGDGADRVTISGGAVEGLIDLGDGRNRFDGTGAEGVLNVRGGEDADVIIGGDGNDIINGGGGLRDLLTGGLGADTFVFSSELHGNGRRDVAVITDFEVGVDTLDIDIDQVAGLSRAGDALVVRFDGDDRDILIINGVSPSQFDDLFL